MQTTKILLVEDDSDIRKGLSILLEQAGYNVISAKNGREALDQMSRMPSLVILDIMLPDYSGFEISRKIRQDCNCNVPILFLSALDSFADKENGFLAGGDDYLTKPFDNSELLLRAAALLRRYKVIPTWMKLLLQTMS